MNSEAGREPHVVLSARELDLSQFLGIMKFGLSRHTFKYIVSYLSLLTCTLPIHHINFNTHMYLK